MCASECIRLPVYQCSFNITTTCYNKRSENSSLSKTWWCSGRSQVTLAIIYYFGYFHSNCPKNVMKSGTVWKMKREEKRRDSTDSSYLNTNGSQSYDTYHSHAPITYPSPFNQTSIINQQRTQTAGRTYRTRIVLSCTHIKLICCGYTVLLLYTITITSAQMTRSSTSSASYELLRQRKNELLATCKYVLLHHPLLILLCVYLHVLSECMPVTVAFVTSGSGLDTSIGVTNLVVGHNFSTRIRIHHRHRQAGWLLFQDSRSNHSDDYDHSHDIDQDTSKRRKGNNQWRRMGMHW